MGKIVQFPRAFGSVRLPLPLAPRVGVSFGGRLAFMALWVALWFGAGALAFGALVAALWLSGAGAR